MLIYLTLQKDDKQLLVRYNPEKYAHAVFENNKHIGDCKLREFFFDGWKCINKEFEI